MSSIEIAKHPHLMNITTFGWISVRFSLGLLQISIAIYIFIYWYTVHVYMYLYFRYHIYPLAQATDLYSWRINPSKVRPNFEPRSSGHLPGFQVYTPCSDMYTRYKFTWNPSVYLEPFGFVTFNMSFGLQEFTRYNIQQYTIYMKKIQWYVKDTMICQKIYDPRHPGWGEGMTGPSKLYPKYLLLRRYLAV